MLGRQENHRRFRGPDIFHQFKAINAGKHNVKQNQIKGFLLYQIGGFHAVVSTDTGISGPVQAQPDQLGNWFFVIHSKDFYHTTASFLMTKVYHTCIRIASETILCDLKYTVYGIYIYFGYTYT